MCPYMAAVANLIGKCFQTVACLYEQVRIDIVDKVVKDGCRCFSFQSITFGIQMGQSLLFRFWHLIFLRVASTQNSNLNVFLTSGDQWCNLLCVFSEHLCTVRTGRFVSVCRYEIQTRRFVLRLSRQTCAKIEKTNNTLMQLSSFSFFLSSPFSVRLES